MTQEKALAILKSGKNVFLTGQAGAGKTYVLNQYIRYLKEHKIGVAITASTGIAATHMNGQTIHAWSGIGVKEHLSSSFLAGLQEKKYFYDKMERTKVLIIDEVSMLHGKQLNMVNEVLKFMKNSTHAFGGVQVIFSGDFFQLPPVGQTEETNKEKFAFMSDAWLEAQLTICYLKEQHRQDDLNLNQILNQIRDGNINQQSIEKLHNTQDYGNQLGNQTQLFTHNANVNQINLERLKQIETKPKPFKAQTKGNPFLVESLKKSVLTDELLELKVGAKVMFIKNNYEKNYFNGTLGEVIKFTPDGFPIVKTKDGDKIEAKPETWAIEDETGKTLASFKQVPLRLAWAITIHKSQGMTLDEAQIDLRHTFEPGQGYVALSRVRNLNGMQLVGFNTMALQIDALARKADKRFQELSDMADAKLVSKDLEQQHKAFIEYCGGTLDANQIKRNKEKLQPKAKEKGFTFTVTKQLIEQGLDLNQIIEKRGLKKGTIINHLEKLAAANPDLDLSKFRPKNNTLKQIKNSLAELNKAEESPLKSIYTSLEGRVSFEEIRLALLFIDKKPAK